MRSPDELSLRSLVRIAALFVSPALGLGNPANTIVVANANVPASVRLAEYYAEQRNVPAENLVRIPLPVSEVISWEAFAETLFNPLRTELEARGRIHLVASGRDDAMGRRIDTVIGHEISYLVLCYGVPLRIREDPAHITERGKEAFNARYLGTHTIDEDDPRLEQARKLHTNRSSVDGQLALLAASGEIPTVGWIHNPEFARKSPGAVARNRVIRVARLDGPSPEAVKRLIDSALEGERLGLMGRVYIDPGGPAGEGYQLANDWLQAIAADAEARGFPVELHEPRAVFPKTARFDAPAMYFGWWAFDAQGPFLLPGFRFPAGAIAVHIHSFSAETMRTRAGDPSSRWCAPLVDLGAAATLGNVYEPYLPFSHHLDRFYSALVDGKTFGEAASFALPVLGWMAVAIGDPLYRPFHNNLDDQLHDLRKAETSGPGYTYATLRKFYLLLRETHVGAALAFAESTFQHAPGLALGYAIAREHYERGNIEEARRAVGFAQYTTSLDSTEWILARDIARFLHCSLADPAAATHLYGLILEDPRLPAALRDHLLPEARATAQAAGRPHRTQIWRPHSTGQPADSNRAR